MRFQRVFRNGNILPGTIQFNATFINSRRKKAENPRNDELRFFRLQGKNPRFACFLSDQVDSFAC